MILCNKLKLCDKENLEDGRKIYITVDYTPLEQKKNKQLREKLKEMNKDGNHYVIKNKNNHYVVNVDSLNPVKLSVPTCDKNSITLLSLNCRSIRIKSRKRS